MQYNPSEKGDEADAYASAEILEYAYGVKIKLSGGAAIISK